MATPWGLITGALGLGASGLGSLFDKETPGSHNAQWLQNPEYSWTQPNMQELYNYYNRGLSQIQAGRAPQWYQQYEQAQKPRQRQDLYQQYYGGNWGPGIMDTLKSYQTQQGTPAGKRGTQAGRQLSDYATQSQKIDEFFNTMGANAMQTAEQSYLGGKQNLMNFQGPRGQWDTWDVQPSYQPSWLYKMGQGLVGMAPYAKEMMGGWDPFAQKPYGTGNMPIGQPTTPDYSITQNPNWNSPMSFQDLTNQYLSPFGPGFGSATQAAQTPPSYSTDNAAFPYSTSGTFSDLYNSRAPQGPSIWDTIRSANQPQNFGELTNPFYVPRNTYGTSGSPLPDYYNQQPIRNQQNINQQKAYMQWLMSQQGGR